MFSVENILAGRTRAAKKICCFFCDGGFSESLHHHVGGNDLTEVHREKRSIFGNTFRIDKRLNSTCNLILLVNTKNADAMHLHFETSTTGKKIKHELKPNTINFIEIQKENPTRNTTRTNNRDFYISLLTNLDRVEMNLQGNPSFPRTVSFPQELTVKAFWKKVTTK